MDQIEPEKSLKLISPRIVALVSTLHENGVVNAAPYSWVFPFSFTPPMIAIGIGKGGKHTQVNSEREKEFVVNLISEEFAQRAVSLEKKHGIEEDTVTKAGLHVQESLKVKTPGIKESKVRLECKYTETIEPKNSDHVLIVGEIIAGKAMSANLDELGSLQHSGGPEFRKIGEIVEFKRFK